MGLGRGPSNDDEGSSVSADLKCFRKGVWGWGGGPLMMVKDSLFLLISNVLGRGPTNDGEGFFVSADFKCFRKRVLGWGRGPLIMMKDSLFLLISKALGRGCETVGPGRGPTNDNEGFSVFADFKCFSKRVWGREGAH